MRLLLIVISLFSLSACSRVAFKIDDKIKAMDTGVLVGPPTGVPGTPGGPLPGASPTPPVVGQPTPPVVGQPTPPVVGQPTPPVVVQPTPPVVVQPTPPVVVQPTPPVVVQPTPPVVVQPTPPVVVQPTPPVGDPPVVIVDPIPPSVPQLPVYGVNVPSERVCSDFETKLRRVNVNLAHTLAVTVSQDGVQKCSITDTELIRSSLNAGYLPLSSCLLTDGQYSVSVKANGTELTLETGYGTALYNQFSISGGAVSANIKLLLDSNPSRSESLGGLPSHRPGVVCDRKASPLFVDFRKNSTDYDILSSPQNGVMFDILGQNGDGNKIQISWFERGRFGLLALPNSRGEVLNIDQLFGDNTKGPDGKFATNGFTALAKHDSNGDKVIDAYDPVYKSLRLWFDFNRDGKADRRELKTLSEMKLVAIDLDYDASFREVDKYGNELMYKSVVKFKSGRLRSIFDIWFKLP